MRRGKLKETEGRSFTLTELLIVVSIIIILMSLLLPALGKAKDFSKRTTCSANVSQLCFTLNMYADDSNDFFPPFNPGVNVAGWINYNFFPNLLVYAGAMPAPQKWKLESFGNITTGIWRCPSVRETVAGDLANEIQWGGGYGVNYCHIIKNQESPKRCQLTRPSRIFLLGDGIGSNVGQTPPQPYGTSYKLVCSTCYPWPSSTGAWAAPRHINKAVVGFPDGHSDARDWGTLQLNQDDIFAHYSY